MLKKKNKLMEIGKNKLKWVKTRQKLTLKKKYPHLYPNRVPTPYPNPNPNPKPS